MPITLTHVEWKTLKHHGKDLVFSFSKLPSFTFQEVLIGLIEIQRKPYKDKKNREEYIITHFYSAIRHFGWGSFKNPKTEQLEIAEKLRVLKENYFLLSYFEL